ncbi:hypothetical protein [Brevundimonas sp. FT23042]|uniref:hypothetical protein n=1 Tax=Brevundimonas sp. FT23042 TaxID=3393749 RepID=UPI003B585C5C
MRHRGSPALNTAVIAALIGLFVVTGAILWLLWSTEAQSAAGPLPFETAGLWAIVVVGGPIALFVALLIGRMRSGKASRRVDPETPPDDPAKGM